VDIERLTDQEIRKLAVLINCFTAIGSELLGRTNALKQGHANLQKFRNENKELLEDIHSHALKGDAVSPLRLAEDLERAGPDVLQLLNLVQRCLLASIFLSHCIATTGKQEAFPVTEQPAEQRRLH
jgi:hypothetical protein